MGLGPSNSSNLEQLALKGLSDTITKDDSKSAIFTKITLAASAET